MPLALGLMSGTSLDGVDVAVIETEGESVTGFGATGYRAYTDAEKATLREALRVGASLGEGSNRAALLAEAEALVTTAHAEAVEAFLAANGIRSTDIDVIGFHGQTVLHRPDRRITVQIGDGAALARRLGRPVVYDFRAADVAAGGQGAPLVPVFHRALVRAAGFAGTVAVVNVGGVANVTFVGPEVLSAFDTGPGNALIDDLMRERTGRPLDDGGRTAARGRPDEPLLAWLLVHPFFARPPPKSLDRNALSHRLAGHLSTEDAAATLTAFTARSIARAADHWTGERPATWIICGGGARNGELLRLLRWSLGVDIVTADQVGWSSAFLEAQAFGFLAVRAMQGLPLTFPGTTGVPAPLTGGRIARP